jgi:hypothetical protein
MRRSAAAKSFDPLARKQRVFDWTRPSAADGETVHQPLVAMPDCIRSGEWLQHWDPFAAPGVNGGRTG